MRQSSMWVTASVAVGLVLGLAGQANAASGPDFSRLDEKTEAICADKPERCEAARERADKIKARCAEDPQGCAERHEKMKARHQAWKEKCEADPAACEEKKKAWKDKREKRKA